VWANGAIKAANKDFGKGIITYFAPKRCQFPSAINFFTEIKWYNFLLLCFVFFTSPSKKRVMPDALHCFGLYVTTWFSIQRDNILMLRGEYSPEPTLCMDSLSWRVVVTR
jgi:hypothetical protein